MNQLLIRFARKHSYEIAEGFLDGSDPKWEGIIKSALAKLPPDSRKLLKQDVENLALQAEIPLPVAWSAMMNWVMLQFLNKSGPDFRYRDLAGSDFIEFIKSECGK